MKKNLFNNLPYKYIVIEGLPGTERSEFINKISKNNDIRKIINPVDENPFLEKFFQDIEVYSFQTQLYFLLTRYKQQITEIKREDLFNQTIISDYIFARDNIYAKLTLSKEDYLIYEQVYNKLQANIRKPDLVIFFQLNQAAQMKRIRKMNKLYSKYISPIFIQKLLEEYNNFFFNYTETPLLIIDISNIDFLKNEVAFNEICNQIISLDSMRKFYNPTPDYSLF
ncbi:MAG TPA: deoxynucleoside kinase [bacterium]|nr:deoxynucleoside kinase [bacterium]HOL47098.1 deoxynucleoside kinase [bacterium]HPQ18852.1 deoxynucleoside kinase [bacterium]